MNNSNIEHPSHYQSDGGYECIEVMRAILTEEQFKGFCLGNAFKYIWRAGKKDIAEFDEDTRKANWYLRYLHEHGDTNTTKCPMTGGNATEENCKAWCGKNKCKGGDK